MSSRQANFAAGVPAESRGQLRGVLGGAGHGGQILVSDSVAALVAGSLPPGVTLQDLGEHRLKDLRPQRIRQVVIEGLPADFPALRSLDARPNNLPVQVTSFVGRERELIRVADLLGRTRLLTLSGPGGTGKTRLALQLAADVSDRYPDGVWFVALEPLRERLLVLPTVAHTLGIAPHPGQGAIDALAAGIGAAIGTRLPERFIRLFAAVAFVLFGLLLVAQGLGLL